VDGEMMVTVGVDTHTDAHVAAVIDPAGWKLRGNCWSPSGTTGTGRLTALCGGVP
jgi:hypothetical protein